MCHADHIVTQFLMDQSIDDQISKAVNILEIEFQTVIHNLRDTGLFG